MRSCASGGRQFTTSPAQLSTPRAVAVTIVAMATPAAAPPALATPHPEPEPSRPPGPS